LKKVIVENVSNIPNIFMKKLLFLQKLILLWKKKIQTFYRRLWKAEKLYFEMILFVFQFAPKNIFSLRYESTRYR